MDSVSNVIQVNGSSTDSWEEAALAAVDEAMQTLSGPTQATVLEQGLEIDEFGQRLFTVNLAVSSDVDMDHPEQADAEAVSSKRYLIVANQTLASAGLEQLVHELVSSTPSHFHVVVPQVSTSVIHVDPSGMPAVHPTASDDYATARREAENRLHTFRQLFDETAEATLTGEVVVGDPLQAVRRMMERSRFDEIIVSTLPAGVSKWLRMDLPHRIARVSDVPVTSLVQQLEILS